MEVLAPVLAMAGGNDLDRGALAASITDAYIQAVEQFAPGIAREGVRRACAKQTSGWRPSPQQVEAACKAELEDAAFAYVERAKRLLPWSPEQATAYNRLSNEERWKWWIERFEGFYCVSWDSMSRARSNVDRARMLPGWERIEGSARETQSAIAATLDAVLLNAKRSQLEAIDERRPESA
ncbi:MAG: hypothetical protein H6830_04415 [Planctomycetes bacterium]|nr:hypothetical protein [Planctomycetota bacterium]